MPPQALPEDLIKPVLEQLEDRADLCSCARVSQAFYQSSVVVLYRNLHVRNCVVRRDSRGELEVVHPCSTILLKPWYAKYVRHIIESPLVACLEPELTMDFLAALRLCTNLRSFTWTSPENVRANRVDKVLTDYLYVLKRLRVPKLSIVVPLGISSQVLSSLMCMDDLREIGVHTRDADFIRTESTAAALRKRVTHLDFLVGKCNEKESYPSFFTRIPKLRSLHLREAKSHAVLDILSILPDLVDLKTHYIPQSPWTFSSKPASRLRGLEVHIFNGQVLNLWDWIHHVVPYAATLESFVIRDPAIANKSNSYRFPFEWTVPSSFLHRLAETHGSSLRHLILDGVHLAPEDFMFVCEHFQALEWLTVHVAGQCTDFTSDAIRQARKLKFLAVGFQSKLSPGSAAQRAETWMQRGSSKLTSVAIRDESFEGKWVCGDVSKGGAAARFEVVPREIKENVYGLQPDAMM